MNVMSRKRKHGLSEARLRKRMRQEQDEAYQLSRIIDESKRLHREREKERQRLNDGRKRMVKSVADHLVEPKTGVHIKLVLPGVKKLIRRFETHVSINDVLAFVSVHFFNQTVDPDRLSCVKPLSSRPICRLDTLGGLFPKFHRGMLMIRVLDKEEEEPPEESSDEEYVYSDMDIDCL